MTTRAETVGQGDEAFLQALYQGGELLAAGNVVEAKDHLERAFQLQPKNEKGQNLLGLACFKLGLFDRAAEIYEMLVRDNPADPTLRVNLGLVFLKTNALPQAIREFEVATDLAPEHKKSHNYLGLALAQAGEYGRAREHFELAGSDAMVQKMDLAIAGAQVHPPTPPLANGRAEASWGPPNGAGALTVRLGDDAAPPPVAEPAGEVQIELKVEDQVPPEPPPFPAPPMAEVSWDTPPPPPADAGDEMRLAADEGPSYPRPTATAEAPPLPEAQPAAVYEPDDGTPLFDSYANGPGEVAPSGPPPRIDPPAVVAWGTPAHAVGDLPTIIVSPQINEPEVRPFRSSRPPRSPGLAQVAPVFTTAAAEDAETFRVDGEVALVRVQGELLTRCSGMLSYEGRIDFYPELKRFRGRPTDKPFGEADARMTRARGAGILVVDRRGKRFVPLALSEESTYFREDVVFAFEESVTFENGRVPSEVPPDLDLVHLQGSGSVLLSVAGAMRSWPVTAQAPVTLPLQHLVGWYGALTPRMVPVGWDARGNPTRAGVELNGEGFALFCVPME